MGIWFTLAWFLSGLSIGILGGMIYPLIYAWRWIRKILMSIEVKHKGNKNGEIQHN